MGNGFGSVFMAIAIFIWIGIISILVGCMLAMYYFLEWLF